MDKRSRAVSLPFPCCTSTLFIPPPIFACCRICSSSFLNCSTRDSGLKFPGELLIHRGDKDTDADTGTHFLRTWNIQRGAVKRDGGGRVRFHPVVCYYSLCSQGQKQFRRISRQAQAQKRRQIPVQHHAVISPCQSLRSSRASAHFAIRTLSKLQSDRIVHGLVCTTQGAACRRTITLGKTCRNDAAHPCAACISLLPPSVHTEPLWGGKKTKLRNSLMIRALSYYNESMTRRRLTYNRLFSPSSFAQQGAA